MAEDSQCRGICVCVWKGAWGWRGAERVEGCWSGGKRAMEASRAESQMGDPQRSRPNEEATGVAQEERGLRERKSRG